MQPSKPEARADARAVSVAAALSPYPCPSADACHSSVRERRGGHGRRRRYHARSTRRAGAFRFLPPSFGTQVVRVDRSRPVGLGGAWKQTGACCCRGGCEKAVPFGLGGRRTDSRGGAQCVGGWVRHRLGSGTMWRRAYGTGHRRRNAQRASWLLALAFAVSGLEVPSSDFTVHLKTRLKNAAAFLTLVRPGKCV